MKKDYTDIILVLDRSGSMESVKTDTIGGVNNFVMEQQKVPGEARFTLFQFDHEYERATNAVLVQDVKPLTIQTYQPRGNTCLFGAIGCAIKETGERFNSMPEDQRPEHVVFVIVTDGEENSSHAHEWSKAHTAASIKADIDRQSGAYKWEFVYIGANQDAFANSAKIGVSAKSTLNYTANDEGTQKLYGSLSSNLRSMRMGDADDMSWSADQRKEQEAAKH